MPSGGCFAKAPGMSMNITIVGTGYVGLVTGVCFSDLGMNVTCVDVDAAKIDGLRRGVVPIFEAGLADMVEKNAKLGRLHFTTDLADCVPDSEVVFIGVGTPTDPKDGSADLRYVHAAARDIARELSGYTVVVNKSTVPVGTGDAVEAMIRDTNPKADFAVVSNPEFLREGVAIRDFKRPDRVVIGTQDERSRAVMERLYRPFNVNQTPILYTDRRTAELIKYASNAFLATKIAFINEMADLCEALGADVAGVSRGMGLDTRIGKKFLQAGPGYGGSCFPKDTKALLDISKRAGKPSAIVREVIESNAARKRGMGDKVVHALDGDVSGKTVAVLGLAFKPQTDDTRETPAFPIIEALQSKGAKVRAFDPEAMEESRAHLSGVTFSTDAYDAADGADALVIVTEWEDFRALDLSRLKTIMRAPIMVDLRNVYDGDELRDAGFRYTGIGKPQPAVV